MRFYLYIFASLYSIVAHLSSSSDDDVICRDARIANSLLESYQTDFELISDDSGNLIEFTSAVPGVRYMPNFLTNEELNDLTSMFVDKKSWRICDMGYRLRHFCQKDLTKFEEILAKIVKRLKQNNWLTGETKTLTIETTRYAKNGWLHQHNDECEVENFVITISIGGPGVLTFVRNQDQKKMSLSLASGSANIMRGAALSDYTHGITNVADTRYIISLYVSRKPNNELQFDLEALRLR